MDDTEKKILVARLSSSDAAQRAIAVGSLSLALESAEGHIEAAAEALEVSPRTLWRWVSRAGLLDRAARLRAAGGANDPTTRKRVAASDS